MFTCALNAPAAAIIIAVIIVQYAFAIYCLLKLAFLDIDKRKYVLWNLLILLVFFIGGGIFLFYYHKHPELRIKDIAVDVPSAEIDDSAAPNIPLPDDQSTAEIE